jgi:TetR/AcrR family transcriptional regulator
VARDLFGQRGYAAVSIGDIAAEVGVTKAALYHHFPSKDALYAVVMCEALELIGTAIRHTAREPGPVRDKIHRLIETAILRVPLDADMDSMLRDADEHLPPALRQEIAEAERAMRGAIEDLMREGVQTGELKRHDPRLLAHAFWQLLSGFLGQRVVAAGFENRPALAAAVVDLFLHGVLQPGSI